jgi:hypothetical protein
MLVLDSFHAINARETHDQPTRIDPALEECHSIPPIPHKTRDGWGTQLSVLMGRIKRTGAKRSAAPQVSAACNA